MTHREAGHTSHITIVTQRGGRRINDRIGARENLCGAEPTLYDQLLSDVKRMKPADRDEWVTCAACRSKVKSMIVQGAIRAARRGACRG